MSQWGSPERSTHAQYLPLTETKNTLLPFRCSMLILGFPPIEFIRRFLALFEIGIARAIFSTLVLTSIIVHVGGKVNSTGLWGAWSIVKGSQKVRTLLNFLSRKVLWHLKDSLIINELIVFGSVNSPPNLVANFNKCCLSFPIWSKG